MKTKRTCQTCRITLLHDERVFMCLHGKDCPLSDEHDLEEWKRVKRLADKLEKEQK